MTCLILSVMRVVVGVLYSCRWCVLVSDASGFLLFPHVVDVEQLYPCNYIILC